MEGQSCVLAIPAFSGALWVHATAVCCAPNCLHKPNGLWEFRLSSKLQGKRDPRVRPFSPFNPDFLSYRKEPMTL